MRRTLLLALLLPLPLVAVLAMTPAVRVVELAMPGPGGALAPCGGLRLSRGEVWLEEPVHDAIQGHGQLPSGWQLQSLSGASESLHLLLLWRDAQRCEVLASDRVQGRLPADWLAGVPLPWSGWRLAGDRFVLQGKRTLVLGGRQGWNGVLPTGRPLRLYDHGWMELYAGRAPDPPASPVGVDDAVTLRLEGPGDGARFRFRAPVAGALIVERTPGPLPGLELRMGRDWASLSPRGMLDLPAGGEALIEVRWQGMGPRDLDLGFLFTPDPPLRCRARLTRLAGGSWRASLILQNTSQRGLWLAAPGAGTVTWLAGGEPVAAAQPGRPPERIALSPGETIRHEQRLDLPQGTVPDGAEIWLGRALGSVRCATEPIVSQDTGMSGAPAIGADRDEALQ